MLETAAENAITGECNNWAATPRIVPSAAWLRGLIGKGSRLGKRLWNHRPCINSFPGDTLVNVRPPNEGAVEAVAGTADLKPIADIHVGDEVLAYSEWQDASSVAGLYGRLLYQKVTNIYSSVKEQKPVHLTVDDGQKLTPTDGHPFITTEGWRDATLLKRCGQPLLKGAGDDPTHAARVATIIDAKTETATLPAFNL